MKTLESLVDGFEGECLPVWLDRNIVNIRITGMTGYFRLIKKGWFGIKYKTGKEFHGYIGSDRKVRTTEGLYCISQFI